MPPQICPNCGAQVPPRSKACLECGSDERTGWSEDAQTGGLDLPEQEFDYDDFVQREFGSKKAVPRGIHWAWWVVAILLVVVFLVFAVG